MVTIHKGGGGSCIACNFMAVLCVVWCDQETLGMILDSTCVSVGWRPAFKFYNKWVALFGAAICVAIMFIIRWYYALVTFIIVLILYKIVDFLKPGKLLSCNTVHVSLC